MTSMYDTRLDRNDANHAPLTPLSFIERAAEVYPERLAIIHGDLRQTWGKPMRGAASWPAVCSSMASARKKRWR